MTVPTVECLQFSIKSTTKVERRSYCILYLGEKSIIKRCCSESEVNANDLSAQVKPESPLIR